MDNPTALNFADVEITQDTIAVRFGDEYEDRARFDHHSGKWFVWTGAIWLKNEDMLALDWARQLCRLFGTESSELARSLGTASAIGGVEKLARSDRRLAITSDQFDLDPMLMRAPGGTLDLRDGSLRRADQGDLITRTAGCTPAGEDEGEPEMWLRFLNELTRDDAAFIRYLQTICGYCLTGLTAEHALIFAHGPGRNGEAVFINILRAVMGDYAVVAPMETFVASKSDRHPTDLAMLAGARLVTASETEEGRAWAESRIEQLTGGDPVSAQFMRRDFFTFMPIFKPFFIGNHKPALKSVDDAIKRRLQLLPFMFKPISPDPEMEEKLRQELPRIFRWMINGCLDWQDEGLARPDIVVEDTRDYCANQDALGQRLATECESEPETMSGDHANEAKYSQLFGSWKTWCKENGEEEGSVKSLSQALVKRGYEKIARVRRRVHSDQATAAGDEKSSIRTVTRTDGCKKSWPPVAMYDVRSCTVSPFPPYGSDPTDRRIGIFGSG
jgi:putative DNA primase/helicase